MIGYEGASVSDFHMYFTGAWVWRYDSAGDRVVGYALRGAVSEDEDGLAYNALFNLQPLRPWRGDLPSIEVLGSSLAQDAQYILHRFELEYVPLLPDRLVRVSFEPQDRRAFKGMHIGYCTQLPLLNKAPTKMLSDVVAVDKYVHPVPFDFEVLAQGIAEVLSVGTCLAMRRNIPVPDIQSERARNRVREMFNSEDMVCVPDFPVGIIRWTRDGDNATVLHRGQIIGRLVYGDNDSLTFYPDPGAGADRDARKLMKRGYEKLALRLFADKVA